MPFDKLIIKGAKQNNLKNISLELPHDQVIAVTGVSGSGKSSLAFETVFAEGQWRFIESLSTYARLFLEKMDRPDVDSIENVRPAIALEQKNPVRGSRSTVGTLTEMYDYFRILYAKVATPFCPVCGDEVRSWDPSAVTAELLEHHAEGRAMLVFEIGEPLDELKKRGFIRILRAGNAIDLEDLQGDEPPPYEVVLDRLMVRDEPRLGDSVETAFREGDGRIKVIFIDGPTRAFSTGNTCDSCGHELSEASPILFSFNHPVGACPQCKGFGNILSYDEELIVPDHHLSLKEGAIEPWDKPAAKWWKKQLLEGAPKSGIDLDRPYNKLTENHRKLLFSGDENFYGIDDFFEELENKRYKLHVRVFLSRYRKGRSCPKCGGKRLNPEALAYKISGEDIAELTELPISELKKFFEDIDLSSFQKNLVKELLRQIDLKLRFLNRVGLDYLTLNREGKTLSGGEYQRVNLSNQLASRLTGTLYVLDEPTVGLHKRDTDRVSEIMAELAGLGNTVLVVEHDRGVIENAQWVVELGPGGGRLGGDVVFNGSMKKFLKANTVTAKYLRDEGAGKAQVKRRTFKSSIKLTGATGHNLKGIDAEFPLGVLSVVTGVSGSGKSTLLVETLYPALLKDLRFEFASPLGYASIKGHTGLKAVKLIDQSPIGRSPRSNPVTYLKVFDPIRKVFSSTLEARGHGYGPGFFSFNVPGGRCETCKGEGYQRLEMYFFEDLYVQCEDCEGTRYGREALNIRYKGKNIHEVLDMTVDEALGLFADIPQIKSRLELMRDIGIGYLRLGQPATTLSGGEAQRLKLCSELGSGKLTGALYILDEPTVGLHALDVEALLGVINRIVDMGNTVIIIEHNLDIIAAADWLVDIGPEGGEKGGKVLYAGPPEGIMRKRSSYTAKYLKPLLRK